MSRITRFFKEVKGELLKVVWPSRIQTVNYTIMVIVFSVVVAAVLGAADYGLLKLFEWLLNK